ncbi:aminodeoxychorismate synthase component I, partial [Haliea sp. AH-315-K21]|nr:aminodeoxychorismate synthase component I [Haliea sp. AH-315-K21]
VVADPSKLIRYQHGILKIESEGNSGESIEEIKTVEPILALAEHFPWQNNNVDARDDIPFCGGLLGYFSYEALHDLHKVSKKHNEGPGLPSILAGIYDWAIIVDHHKQSCTLAAQTDCKREKLEKIKHLLSNRTNLQGESFKITSAFNSNVSNQEYTQAFKKVMQYIQAGDCYQVNMSQCFQATCEGDSLQAFIKLQQQANAPFAAYIEDQNQAVLSFSPERFLQVKNKVAITQPIKGTRARHYDKAKDEKALNDLINSKKDKAENLMIVDLVRNDFGKVCRTGSVRVDALYEPQSFANVHHLVSSVSGELAQSKDVFNLLNACFPGGSITGAPKLRAMEIIAEVETAPRSVYCGSIAWINTNGDMDSNIAIRTLVRDHDQIYCWGGGGIVADSDAQLEYQESLDKISMFMDALS